ncbi:MAG: glucose sorbosone dehydrogenase, partial [Calditrichaeota bacterium]
MKRQLWILPGIIFGIQLQIAQVQFEVRQAFPNLSFVQPVDLQNAGDGTNRLFVVEQRGIIYVFPNDSNVTATQRSTFLDIRDRVDDAGSEEGLLGLAFHPDYAANGYFYVNYTARNPNRSVISRFKVSDNDPNRAEPDSELVILTLPQPYSNHNAGALAFGPNDGYLYITTGDGGNFGDPQCNGQNLQTLLGSILRIDVDRRDPGMNYAIPPDNPFAGNTQGYREEIYAYGLRNPWRMSFDPVTGWLWAADVGQNSWEEIDLIQSGKNYGWAIMEGFHCYNSPWPCAPAFCDTTGRHLTPPLWEYGHNLGISVTGGYVYRGPTVPELTGKYVYADFGSGRIWALEYDGINPPTNTLLLDTQLNISSFGVDEQGELYICSYGNGRI